MCISYEVKEKKFAFVIEGTDPQNANVRLRQKTQDRKHASKKAQWLVAKEPFSYRQWDSRKTVTPVLSMPLEDQAITWYFHQFVTPRAGLIEAAQEHKKYLTPMWRDAPRDSPISLATLALSHSAFANATNNPVASMASKSFYYQAISLIKKSIQNPVDSCSDQILLATMLLGTCEVCLPYHRWPGTSG